MQFLSIASLKIAWISTFLEEVLLSIYQNVASSFTSQLNYKQKCTIHWPANNLIALSELSVSCHTLVFNSANMNKGHLHFLSLQAKNSNPYSDLYSVCSPIFFHIFHWLLNGNRQKKRGCYIPILISKYIYCEKTNCLPCNTTLVPPRLVLWSCVGNKFTWVS